MWDLLPVTGDDDARTLLRSYPNPINEVAWIKQPVNIDRAEGLREWN